MTSAPREIGAVVLAAGQGTRMRSRVPKVLHPLAGRPMLAWVLHALADAGVGRVVVVVGHGAEAVRAILPDGVESCVQAEQLGTGHAAQVGLAGLAPECDTVLVASGDTPLVEGELIRALLEEHLAGDRAATVATALLADGGRYGRVVRGPNGGLRVVEARDATPEQLAIGEVNAGLYAFARAPLERALAGVGRQNAQGEVYLPDALAGLAGPIGAFPVGRPELMQGVNDRVELAGAEAALQRRLRERLMRDGVTMPDPERVYLDAGVRVGADTVLLPGTHLRGSTEVGEGCRIGPDVVIADSRVDADCTVLSAHLDRADVGPGCRVGPFAYLRPGARLERGARAGTYVEIKGSVIGPGAKVPHLSYVGDADVGEGANIGAGNITANYDGFQKHRTVIGARARTGSDCVFVAPVRVGDDAMTGAGSIITADVPEGALGIARARQSVIEGFTQKAAARARARAESPQEHEERERA